MFVYSKQHHFNFYMDCKCRILMQALSKRFQITLKTFSNCSQTFSICSVFSQVCLTTNGYKMSLSVYFLNGSSFLPIPWKMLKWLKAAHTDRLFYFRCSFLWILTIFHFSGKVCKCSQRWEAHLRKPNHDSWVKCQVIPAIA